MVKSGMSKLVMPNWPALVFKPLLAKLLIWVPKETKLLVHVNVPVAVLVVPDDGAFEVFKIFFETLGFLKTGLLP